MKKSLATLCLIAFAVLIAGTGSSVFAVEILTAGEHNCLYMNAWYGSAYIPRTVSSSDTIASVPFAVIIYESLPTCPNPGTLLTRIQAKLSYDDTKWRYIGAEPTANWPNDFNWDTVNIENGDDYIRLYFTLGSGEGVPAPTDIAKAYATLKFVPLCQPRSSYSEIYTVWDDDHFNQVDISGNTWWLAEANTGAGGYLTLKNYSSTTTMGDQSVTRLVTEEPTVDLPVRVTTNFLSRTMNLALNYNSAKLQFVEVLDIAEIFPYGCLHLS